MSLPAPIPLPVETMAQKMVQARRWLLWRSIPNPGRKPKKVPLYADGQFRGTTDTPEDIASLVTYEEACRVFEANPGKYTGLGFALGPDGTGNVWQGADFDGVGARPMLLKLAEQLPGYRETSPSGDGLHVIGYGPTLFENLPQHEGVEAYCSGRFFTVTMQHVMDSPIVDMGPAVVAYLASLRPKKEPPVPPEFMFSPERPGVSIEDLRSLLERIPVKQLPYFDWFAVQAGVHHQFHDTPEREQAFQLVVEWSKGPPEAPDPRFDGERKLAQKWTSFGKNPKYTAPGAARTIHTVKAFAERYTPLPFQFQPVPGMQEPGGVPGTPGTPGTPQGGNETPFGTVHVSAFMDAPLGTPWLIKGILPAHGLAQCYGDTAVGKTFFVIDLMMHVALGKEWNGRRVCDGNVVYVAAEGVAGARKRLKAYAIHHGVCLDFLPLMVMTQAPNVMDEKNFVLLGQTLASMGQVNLVVIDTLAQTMPGGNENSSEGMGLAIARYTRLVRTLGCTVLLVHHSGKDASKGDRGWSGQKGALDTQFHVESTDGQRVMKITKQKDGEPGPAFPFHLHGVLVGMDADGEAITSCVAVLGTEPTPEKPVPGKPVPGLPEIKGEWRQRVWRHIGEGIRMGLEFQHNEVVQAVFNATPPTSPGKPDRRRDNITRAIRSLVDDNFISYQGTLIGPFNPENRKAAVPDEEFGGEPHAGGAPHPHTGEPHTGEPHMGQMEGFGSDLEK